PADAARLLGRRRTTYARAVGVALHRRPVRAHPRSGRLARERRRAAAATASGAARRDGGDHRGLRGRRGSGGEGVAHRPPPRRREVLRLSLAAMVGLVSVEDLGVALSDVTTAILTGALRLARRGSDELEFGIIAMGRYGGAELGFGSDADIMYVYRGTSGDADAAQKRAEQIVHEIKRLTDDVRLPLDLDLGLRPEGKNGAIVR